MLSLIVFLVIAAVFTLLWASVTVMEKLREPAIRFLMRYFTHSFDTIRYYLVLWLYMGLPVLGAAVLLGLYEVNLFNYLALEEPKHVVFLALAFIAQHSITGLLMLIASKVKPKVNLWRELYNVPWIKAVLAMPPRATLATVIAAAVVEELFFRGAVFLILAVRFGEIGVGAILAISTLFFMVHQVAQTLTLAQAYMLAVGALSIALTGCLMIFITGSVLPTLLCHMAYAAYFVRGSNFTREYATYGPAKAPR